MCDGRDILGIKPPLGQFFSRKILYREVYGTSVESVTEPVGKEEDVMWIKEQNGKSILNTENYDRIGISQENEGAYLVVAVKDYVEMPGLTRFRAAMRKAGSYKELEVAQTVLEEIYGQIVAGGKVYEMPADRSSV